MASISGDEAFARYANEHGFATLDQLESARQLQAEKARNNIAATLAEILVSQGILTPALRENIEKKLQAQQQGGIKQLGNYKLIKKLGEGGMGAVYLAEDTIAERKVALKVLPRKLAGEGEFLTRFRREAKAAGKLNHVNIVTAFSVGEEMGHHFYVMEYCEGEPLDKLLKRQHFLPWDRATEIIIQVARGLEHAHKHGFLHRDIKPANVFMTKDGTAKILDLGLSKNIADAEQSFQTQSGVALGTPHYISPEQAQGERNVDGRTDIYSLGASYYHLLTGQTPFKATTAAAVIMKHLTEQLPNPQDIRSEIPDEVVHVIERMMAKSPLDRYADCAELLADLELVAQGKAPSSHALEPAKSTIMPSMKRNSVASAVDHMRPVRKAPQPPPLVPTKRLEESVPRLERRPAPKKNTPFLPIAFAGVVVLAIVIGLLLSRSKPPATSVKPEAGTAGTGSAAVSTSSDKGGGLLGEYYSNMDLSGTPATRVDPELDFNWGDGSPMSGIPSERFSVRWTGFVTAAHSEVYTFSTTSDDGVRLWVDDRLLIDHWRTSNSEDRSEKIQLKAGQRHRIRLEFFDEIGLAIIKLQWSSPSTPKQIIPRERLTPSAAPMRAPPVSQAPPPPLTQPAPAAAASAIFPSTPAERWKEALDLLALIDLEKDTVNGTWTRSAEGLTPPASGIGDKQKVEIPYQPPSEYDLRISFTPRDHGCDLTPILARNGRQFSFKLWGRDGATTTGFEIINGQSILENSTMKTIERFTPGRRYTAVIEVRDAGLRA
ncbi:MAG TPA: protein kinase, partial [Planctomycetota bacterium]|nr:protein kinase [Planctomycetota bacterium]